MSHSNTLPVRNLAPLTARSSSLRCVSAADSEPSTRLQNNTPKLAGQNPESISQEALYHETLARTFSRYQVFAKLLWKLSEDASQRSSLSQMSLKKITRSSDSFSTVPPIVSGGDWGYIVRDLETIIVLVLLAFNFIHQRSHHSLTLPRVTDPANEMNCRYFPIEERSLNIMYSNKTLKISAFDVKFCFLTTLT